MKAVLTLLLVISVSLAYRHRHHKKANLLSRSLRKEVEVNDGGKPKQIPEKFPDQDLDAKVDMSEALALFRNHHMTDGEIKIIFNTIDINKNNAVSYDEWQDFHTEFIGPFQKECDKSQDYFIEKKEFKNCMEKEMLAIKFSGVDEKTMIDDIFVFMDKSKEGKINLADFIFLKRVNIALQDCGANGKITAASIPCSLHIVAPGRLIDRSEASQIFTLAFLLNRGKNVEKATIDALSFINIAHLFYYFNVMDNPSFKGSLVKYDILRGIDEQVLPIDLSKNTVNEIFNYINPHTNGLERVSFAAFAFYLYVFRVFNRFTEKYSGLYMTEEEFLKVLKDPMFDPLVRGKIDVSKVYDKKEVEEFEKNAGGMFHNSERDYLIEFLQTGFKTKEGLPYFMGLPLPENNEVTRKVVYTIFEGRGWNKMPYLDFLRFYKMSFCFCEMDENFDGFVSAREIRKSVGECFPYVSLNSQEYLQVQLLMNYLNFDKMVNIKQYYDYVMYKVIFKRMAYPGAQYYVNELSARKGMAFMGMVVTKRILFSARDPIVHDEGQQFNYDFAFHGSLDMEVAMKRYFDTKKLDELSKDGPLLTSKDIATKYYGLKEPKKSV